MKLSIRVYLTLPNQNCISHLKTLTTGGVIFVQTSFARNYFERPFQNKRCSRAVKVAQLAKPSLPIPACPGSNAAVRHFYSDNLFIYCWLRKRRKKEKRLKWPFSLTVTEFIEKQKKTPGMGQSLSIIFKVKTAVATFW